MRLRFAFEMAERLHIDDPVAWFDTIPPAVFDGWMAFYSLKADEQKGEKEMMDPMEALQRMSKRHG